MAGYSLVPSNFEFLKKLRSSTTAFLKPCLYLRESTKLRYYQVIGTTHLICLNRMILADSAGLGKCVSKDTYLYTNKGILKAGDLLQNHMKEDGLYPLSKDFYILTGNGLRKSSIYYFSGVKNGFKIKTNKGYELTALGHHPVLVPLKSNLDYKKIEELNIGDYICINRTGYFSDSYVKLEKPTNNNLCAKNYNFPEYLDENLAELLGYYVSEGDSSTKWNFSITQFDTKINARIRFLLKECFGYIENNTKSYDISIKVNSVKICEFLRNLGLDLKAKAGGKLIPESILKSPKNVVKRFLQAYYEGDGNAPSDNTSGVECSSKSEELLKQIQFLLLGFGIISKRRIKMVKVKNERRLYWRLYFHGKDLDIFEKEIGFISEKKNKQLKIFCGRKRNTNLDIIPIGDILVDIVIRDLVKHINNIRILKKISPYNKGTGLKSLFGRNYLNFLNEVRYKKKRLTYYRLNTLIDKIEYFKLEQYVSVFKFLKELVEKNLFFDKIVYKEPKLDTFVDFHVPDVHNFIGNGFINHNTLQLIAAYSFLFQKDPTLKLLIVTPKSAMDQWQEEFFKFTKGIKVHVIANEFGKIKNQNRYAHTSYLKRHKLPYSVLRGFEARKIQYSHVKANVLVTNYFTVQQDYTFLIQNRSPNYMVCFDEIQECKNRKAATHIGALEVSQKAARVYGLSATIIKNRLEEAYNIFRIVVPGLFGSVAKFNKNFVKIKKMKKFTGKKKIFFNKIIGYKNLQDFRTIIEPYFLIRKTKDVAKELPSLTSKKIILEMTESQSRLYQRAITGDLYRQLAKSRYYEFRDIFEKLSTPTDKDIENIDRLKIAYEESLTSEGLSKNKIAALSYCQLISNGPKWLDENETGDSSKEIEFNRLFDQELRTEKTIVFTRFKSGIPRLEAILNELEIKHTKITGDVVKEDRKEARLEFQDMTKDTSVIFITSAGSAALNLQSANIILFYDTPWSYGDLYQTIGRAQRIGSLYSHIHVIHMINRRSIDNHVINILEGKKALITDVMGDIAQGAIEFKGPDSVIFKEDESSIEALFKSVFKKIA